MKRMETERLIVRNFLSEDWQDLYEYLSQPEVLRYEPGDVSDEADCRKKAVDRSEREVFWAVCLNPSQKMIGYVYFAQKEPKNFATWEMGYIFNPKYYGQGYATEACRRIMEYGFAERNAHRIVAMCNPENASSWKLLERLGMRREGHCRKEAFFRETEKGMPLWHDAYLYALLEEEWQEKTQKE